MCASQRNHFYNFESFHSYDLHSVLTKWISPGSGRSPGEGNGNTLQYFCLENPMDRGAWRATVYSVTKSQDTTVRAHTNTGQQMHRCILYTYIIYVRCAVRSSRAEDVLGDPVAKTLGSQCRALRVDLWSGNQTHCCN